MSLFAECDAEGCDVTVEWDGAPPVGWWEAITTEESPASIFTLTIPSLGQHRRVARLCPVHRPVRLKGDASSLTEEELAAGPPELGPQPPAWVAEVLKNEENGGPK